MMILIIMFFPFLSLTACQAVYQEFYSQDSTCSGQPTVKFIPNGACNLAQIQPGCINFLNYTGIIMSCPLVVILPQSWASIQGWASNSDCSGVPDYTISVPPNQCSGYWLGPTIELDCDTHSIRECEQGTANCQHCPSKPANAKGVCTAGNPTQNFPMLSYIFTCPHRCKPQEAAILTFDQPASSFVYQPTFVLVNTFIFAASSALFLLV